ncbi:MAG: hypothetical protein IH991_11090 [Planctomycetes bacterium]|nr:hypothetical protein [Planctomycetota bacterium]
MSVDFMTAKLLTINGGWQTINTEHEGGIGADTLAVAKMLIPAYLKDLSERRFIQGHRTHKISSLEESILKDLAHFVQQRHGDPEDGLSARGSVTLNNATTRAEALADLLIHFVETGRVEIRQMITTRRKPALLEVEHDGHRGLLIPYTSLERLTAKSSVPAPSLDQLYRVLDEADILLDEHDDGPVIRWEYFDERRRMSRVKRSGLLKVHG